MQQIIALGGGGFSMEPDNLALDRYILDQTDKQHPKVCFLPQASGESRDYIINFYKAFTELGAVPSWLSLFQVQDPNFERRLLAQDVIYVGGGNTFSMIALWQAWGLDLVLRQALEKGVVLAGISAGAICWFEQGITDSYGDLQVMDCLGFLPGSCVPHYNGEAERQPRYKAFVADGSVQPGIALDDGAAAHYVDGTLKQIIASCQKARAYRVTRTDRTAQETPLDVTVLPALS